MTKKRLSPTELSEEVKGTPRGFLAEFLQQRALIIECLQQGHPMRSVFAYLKGAEAISFSFHTFRRYVLKFIPTDERRFVAQTTRRSSGPAPPTPDSGIPSSNSQDTATDTPARPRTAPPFPQGIGVHPSAMDGPPPPFRKGRKS